MKHYPATRFHLPLQGLSHARAPGLQESSRLAWFALGFFGALMLTGVAAGLLRL